MPQPMSHFDVLLDFFGSVSPVCNDFLHLFYSLQPTLSMAYTTGKKQGQKFLLIPGTQPKTAQQHLSLHKDHKDSLSRKTSKYNLI